MQSFVVGLSLAVLASSCKKSSESNDKKPAENTPNDCSTTKAGGHDSGDHSSMKGMTLAEDCLVAINTSAFYVVNGGESSISVIDPVEEDVIGTIPLTGVSFPHHISLDVPTDRLVVADPGMDLSGGHEHMMAGMKGSLVLLDAASGKVVKTKSLDAMNHNGAFSSDGNEIWTAAMASPGSLLVLDSDTLDTKNTVAVGNMPTEVTFSVDGKRAFVANGESGTVSVVDSTSKKIIKTVAVGKSPVGAWQGNDDLMYVDNEGAKSISAIDSDTLAVVRTYDLGFKPGMAATAPNGDLWVSDGDKGQIVYFMAGDTMKMGEISTGAGAHAIAFSTDGKFAAVTNQTAGTVTLIDVATHKELANVSVGKKPNGLVFRKK